MKTTPLLPSCYFPPVSWWKIAVRNGSAVLDTHEHYVRQTWRNRCRIDGANGTMDLIIPVHTLGNHTPMHQVTLDHTTPWQKIHWQSIRSAYGQSPFFEHYASQIEELFRHKPTHLHQWNEKIIHLISGLLKLSVQFSNSSAFEVSDPDFRKILSPKYKGPVSVVPTVDAYVQVFSDRHGFRSDLSILDLLFCTGPQAGSILMK